MLAESLSERALSAARISEVSSRFSAVSSETVTRDEPRARIAAIRHKFCSRVWGEDSWYLPNLRRPGARRKKLRPFLAEKLRRRPPSGWRPSRSGESLEF